MNADLFHETFVVRIAFVDLVHHVSPAGTNPDTVDLASVTEALDEFGLDRFAGLLLAQRVVDTYREGLDLAAELRADWLGRDRRPVGVAEFVPVPSRARGAWWRRVRERAARAIVADDDLSAELSAIDLEARDREGRPR